jgi:hypothetical protein
MARSALDGRASGFVCFHQEDTMTREEYEERRRALEEQHRADIALLNAAQELRLRALERFWREGVEEGEPVPAAAALIPPVLASVAVTIA